jgi:hypothetical protein
MKKIFLVLILFLGMASFQSAIASVSPSHETNPAVLKNKGYSEEMIRLIGLSKAQIAGQEYNYDRKEPEYYKNKYIKFFRWVYMQADPGVDDQKFMQHDINYSIKLDDL